MAQNNPVPAIETTNLRKKFGEIDVRQGPKTVEAVGDGQTLRRLPVVLLPHQVGERHSVQSFDPVLRRYQRRFLVLELFCQAGGEIRLRGIRLPLHLLEHACNGITPGASGSRQTIGPQICGLANPVLAVYKVCKIGERFHEGEPQHHGERPQFSYRKRSFRLIARYGIDQALLGERAVCLQDDTGGKIADEKTAIGSCETRQRLSKPRG